MKEFPSSKYIHDQPTIKRGCKQLRWRVEEVYLNKIELIIEKFFESKLLLDQPTNIDSCFNFGEWIMKCSEGTVKQDL